MRLDRLRIYEYTIENAVHIQAPQHFFRYVKILLDRSHDDIFWNHDHLRTWMAQKLCVNDRTLGSYEDAWEANGWLEKANPKNGLPQTRKLGKRFQALWTETHGKQWQRLQAGVESLVTGESC